MSSNWNQLRISNDNWAQQIVNFVGNHASDLKSERARFQITNMILRQTDTTRSLINILFHPFYNKKRWGKKLQNPPRNGFFVFYFTCN